MRWQMDNHDMDLICADLSMRRPGFALQHYSAADRKATVQRMSYVDNKFAKKPHGQMLAEIAHELHTYQKANPDAILVRERGFFRYAAETEVLCRVIGVSDLYAWATGKKVFEEIAPTAIKKLLTGSGKATKEEVADAQEKYVGKQEYAVDDLSDAVGVGIAWFLQNKLIDFKED